MSKSTKRMSLISFFEALEGRLDTLSADDLCSVLRSMAKAVSPDDRRAFLAKLEPGGKPEQAIARGNGDRPTQRPEPTSTSQSTGRLVPVTSHWSAVSQGVGFSHLKGASLLDAGEARSKLRPYGFSAPSTRRMKPASSKCLTNDDAFGWDRPQAFANFTTPSGRSCDPPQ